MLNFIRRSLLTTDYCLLPTCSYCLEKFKRPGGERAEALAYGDNIRSGPTKVNTLPDAPPDVFHFRPNRVNFLPFPERPGARLRY